MFKKLWAILRGESAEKVTREMDISHKPHAAPTPVSRRDDWDDDDDGEPEAVAESRSLYEQVMDLAPDVEKLTKGVPGGHEPQGWPDGSSRIDVENKETAPWPHLIVTMANVPPSGNPTLLLRKGWTFFPLLGPAMYRISEDTPIVFGGTTFVTVEPIDGAPLPANESLHLCDDKGQMYSDIRAGRARADDLDGGSYVGTANAARNTVMRFVRTVIRSHRVPRYLAAVLTGWISADPKEAARFKKVEYEIEMGGSHTSLHLDIDHSAFRGTMRFEFSGSELLSVAVKGAHAEVMAPFKQSFTSTIEMRAMAVPGQYNHAEPAKAAWEVRADEEGRIAQQVRTEDVQNEAIRAMKESVEKAERDDSFHAPPETNIGDIDAMLKEQGMTPEEADEAIRKIGEGLRKPKKE